MGDKVLSPNVWIDQDRAQNSNGHLLPFNSKLSKEILDAEDHVFQAVSSLVQVGVFEMIVQLSPSFQRRLQEINVSFQRQQGFKKLK